MTQISYEIKYNNELDAGTLSSDTWVVNTITYQLKDDSNGLIFLYANGVKGSDAVGSIDYVTGAVGLSFNASTTNQIKLTVTPSKQDIRVVRDKLLISNTLTVVTNG